MDEYHSEVLPEDKASFVEAEKNAGRKVIMVGDGINDSPALSAADVGIAISDGAEIAREIADVTVGADDLHELVTLKKISNGLMERIHRNYRLIVGINTSLIVLGVAGAFPLYQVLCGPEPILRLKMPDLPLPLHPLPFRQTGSHFPYECALHLRTARCLRKRVLPVHHTSSIPC